MAAGAADASAKPPVVVKKYANRRLYNTESSSYITLDNLAQMVREGRDFIVYDAKSGEDITRSVLTQIIVEEESKGSALLPTTFLRHLIGFYGDSMQNVVPRYLEQSMANFTTQQQQVRQAMQQTVGNLFPFDIEQMGRQNMAMIERAIAADVPFAWVAADTVYGTGDVEMALRRAGKGYVLGTNANHPFHFWEQDRLVSGTAEAIARELPETAWTRLSAGEGTKGARLHDWHYLELADLDASQFDGPPGAWTRGLLVRRHIANGSMAFFSTWCPLGTSLETLVAVEGRRWASQPGAPPA